MNLQDPPTCAIILAAGRGRRLRPHTDHTPKPLLPVHGRPLLHYTLTALQRAGVRHLCLVIGHLGEQIQRFVGDGRHWNLTATYIHQQPRLGTAHALQLALPFLHAPTLVLAADYLLPLHYLADLKAAYQQARTPLAVSLKRVPPGELSARSSVHFDPTGRITAIIEKPQPGAAPGPFAASLIYIVPPAIRPFLQAAGSPPRPDALSPRGEYELPIVINHMIAAGHPITGLLQPPPAEWRPELAVQPRQPPRDRESDHRQPQ